ncbi:2-hydroxychromene-2-carboxylate isomerase [Comamonas sp. BIGb0124]|uniref:2-hydroxychromene-2-carboxylate isomerase n=1 Tax=Comamonas sp. BIGb0124 TaxID=2485130 RepID=UPI000F4A0071|nr:2-hydroxychromene-2-carboxylate isomerase [Comamonas sp. BIGb0124]ROR24440.1 2-hydroxychromene-2-carboxylate isomerase [Comamonas sp. BIGb0124]
MTASNDFHIDRSLIVRRPESAAPANGTARPLLQIFYGISSPWAYLGAPRAYALADRLGADLALRPIRVIQANGGIPLRTRPDARQHYHAVELDRWRRRLDMPLNLEPRFYPCRTIELAAQAVIAVTQAGLDGRAYSFAVQRALWAEDRDIADVATLRAIARETLGDPLDDLDFERPATAVVEAWENDLATAENLGIFGTPTYVVGTELFWGQDRLDFVEEALEAQRTS